jgi:predicted nucleic acid-binding protein
VATARRGRSTTIRYFDTSAVVAALAEGDEEADASLVADGACIGSVLTFLESSRALARARRDGRISAERERDLQRALELLETRMDVVTIDAPILARARRPFPIEPVRTLDAIHLATAESLELHPSFLTFVTRDKRLRENAQALGYSVE